MPAIRIFREGGVANPFDAFWANWGYLIAWLLVSTIVMGGGAVTKLFLGWLLVSLILVACYLLWLIRG